MFQSRYCLRELDLSHNDFGDEGAMIIGHALGKVYCLVAWREMSCLKRHQFASLFLMIKFVVQRNVMRNDA